MYNTLLILTLLYIITHLTVYSVTKSNIYLYVTQIFIYKVPFEILKPKLLTSTGLLQNFAKVVK